MRTPTKNSAHLHAVSRPVEELSDAQIERLIEFGKREAALIDELQAALEAADDLRALGVARKLVGLEKQIEQ